MAPPYNNTNRDHMVRARLLLVVFIMVLVIVSIVSYDWTTITTETVTSSIGLWLTRTCRYVDSPTDETCSSYSNDNSLPSTLRSANQWAAASVVTAILLTFPLIGLEGWAVCRPLSFLLAAVRAAIGAACALALLSTVVLYCSIRSTLKASPSSTIAFGWALIPAMAATLFAIILCVAQIVQCYKIHQRPALLFVGSASGAALLPT